MIRVLVVDDNAIIRMGLSEALALDPQLEPAGTAASSDEAVTVYRAQRPDVVTMDYRMPGENGIECTRRILTEFPEAKILLLSVFDSEEDILNAVQAGVKGYLTKTAGEVEEVIDAIHEVASGGTFFPASIMQKLEQRHARRDLTDRELNVLKLVAAGKMNKEIAGELSISQAVVKQHLVNLRKKLNASDRTQAVVNAYKRGILKLSE